MTDNTSLPTFREVAAAQDPMWQANPKFPFGIFGLDGEFVACVDRKEFVPLILHAVNSLARLTTERDGLRRALESLTEDPPPTLDEPDADWEVIVKMRAIARAALASTPPLASDDGKNT